MWRGTSTENYEENSIWIDQANGTSTNHQECWRTVATRFCGTLTSNVTA